MPETFIKATLAAIALIAVTAAQAQTHHRRSREPAETERAAPAAPTDKRDSVVAGAGAGAAAFNGRPYWLALAQCGGIYFRLNLIYTDAAVHARVGKPDPKANAEYTKDIKDAIKTATVYFDGAERFLMSERGIERADAVLTYDPQARASGDRLKTLDAAQAAAEACPTLYKLCQGTHPKECSEPLPPTS
jgi:hypothetical protein